MLESILVLGLLGVLMLLGWVAPLVPLESLVWLGWVITVAGLAVGIPAGLAYHVGLRRSLLRAGVLPRRWWLHPTSLHPHLELGARPAVLLWFRLGGAGAVIAFLGCALVGVAAALAFLRGAAL